MAYKLALKLESHVVGEWGAGFSFSYNLMCDLSGFQSFQNLSISIDDLEGRTGDRWWAELGPVMTSGLEPPGPFLSQGS